MAAQARHYEKSIVYSARQVDDKYISKNRHNSHLKSSSRESSPYRGSGKGSLRSSPGGRKRTYNSPNSKASGSPYESTRKKDRADNDMGKNECENSAAMTTYNFVRLKDAVEWSQHVSGSSGKVYYYNSRTQESQWEVPEGWMERDQEAKEPVQKERSARESLKFGNESISRDDLRELRDPRENKDYKYKEKINSKEYRPQDSRSYRDRKNREKESREFWDNFKERDYRERESRDYNDGKHRVNSGSSKRLENKYNSPGIRTVAQSTPSSSTSHSRSYRRPTPDSLNGSGSGSVQDISPPGTPTNDDIVCISTISPAPLYTPHTPLISTSRLPLPTTPHTPLLSPILLNSSTHLSTSYLHPLQQALLLQQQQATTNKDTFGSPKLPTVKNHIIDGSTTPTSLSPMPSNTKGLSMTHSPELSDRNETPPPPPPPLKDHNRMTDSRDRSKQERHQNQTANNEVRSEQRENLNRSKSHEFQTGDTPVKSNNKATETRSICDRLLKKTIKLEKEAIAVWDHLPDLDKYSEHFSPSVADFTTAFYCSTLEKQIATTWEETMTLLSTEGYRSKVNLSISRQNVDSEDSRLDVSTGWVDALNSVISKVESLQDSSMKSEARVTTRETKSSPAVRKVKHNSESEKVKAQTNGEKNHTGYFTSTTEEKDVKSILVTAKKHTNDATNTDTAITAYAAKNATQDIDLDRTLINDSEKCVVGGELAETSEKKCR